MTEQNKVGKKIKEYFKNNNITQEMAAQKLGSTQQIVGKLLNGKSFGKRTATKWSEVFDFNPAWLITGDGVMFLYDKKEVMNTTKKIVEIGSDAFYEQLLKMINAGEIYPANIVREKEAEIKRLNREIGALQNQIELLKEKTRNPLVAEA
jgi:plasmid maintenance system antidote protein VapI